MTVVLQGCDPFFFALNSVESLTSVHSKQRKLSITELWAEMNVWVHSQANMKSGHVDRVFKEAFAELMRGWIWERDL